MSENVISSSEKEEEESFFECSICLDTLHPLNLVRTNCDHDFHFECIETWMKHHPLCPYCRTPLNPKLILQKCLHCHTRRNRDKGKVCSCCMTNWIGLKLLYDTLDIQSHRHVSAIDPETLTDRELYIDCIWSYSMLLTRCVEKIKTVTRLDDPDLRTCLNALLCIHFLYDEDSTKPFNEVFLSYRKAMNQHIGYILDMQNIHLYETNAYQQFLLKCGIYFADHHKVESSSLSQFHKVWHRFGDMMKIYEKDMILMELAAFLAKMDLEELMFRKDLIAYYDEVKNHEWELTLEDLNHQWSLVKNLLS